MKGMFQKGGLKSGSKSHLSAVEQKMYETALQSGNTKVIKYLEAKISKGVHNANIDRNQDIERLAESQGDEFATRQRLERRAENQGTSPFGMSNRQNQQAILTAKQKNTKETLGNSTVPNTPDKLDRAMENRKLTNFGTDLLPGIGDIKGIYEGLKSGDQAGMSLALLGLIPGGDVAKTFKPIIKNYKNHTEMFTDFIKQAKDQKIPINKDSDIYKESLKNTTDAKIFYEKQDALKNLLSEEELKKAYQKSHTFDNYQMYDRLNNDHIKQTGGQASNYFLTERNKHSYDNYLIDLQDNPEKLLGLYNVNSFKNLDLTNPIHRLIARGERDQVSKLFEANSAKTILQNNPEKINNDLTDYSLNSVLDPSKKLKQESLADALLNPVLPEQLTGVKVNKHTPSYRTHQNKLNDINKDLNTFNTDPIKYEKEIKSLLKTRGDLNEAFAIESNFAYYPKKTIFNSFLKNNKKTLTDDDYATGHYLSNLLANPPESKNVKFLGENNDPIDSKFYDYTKENPRGATWEENLKNYEKWKARTSTIRNDGVTPGYYTTPKEEQDIVNQRILGKKDGVTFVERDSKVIPNMVKSLFREHLGKWDWNNPNIHKAVTGLGVAGTIGYNKNQKQGNFKNGGKLKFQNSGLFMPESIRKAKENQSNPFAATAPLTASQLLKLSKIQELNKGKRSIKEQKQIDENYLGKGPKGSPSGMSTGKILHDYTDPVTALVGGLGQGIAKTGIYGLNKAGLKTIGKKVLSELTGGLNEFSHLAKEGVEDFVNLPQTIYKTLQKEKELLQKTRIIDDEFKNLDRYQRGVSKLVSKPNVKSLKDAYPDIHSRLTSYEGQRRIENLRDVDNSKFDPDKTKIWTTKQRPGFAQIIHDYDPKIKDLSIIGVNKKFGDATEGIVEHELQHLVQPNIPKSPEFPFQSLDNELNYGLKLKPLSELKDNRSKGKFIRKFNWSEKGLKSMDEDQIESYNYFTSGTDGLEKAPFVAELRTYMKNKGLIPNIFNPKIQQYHTIKPIEVKKGIETYFKKKDYPLRIANIIEQTPENYELLANIMNKMPSLALPAAGGIGYGLSKQKENKKPAFQRGGFIINKKLIPMEIAKSKYEQAQGLQNRKAAPMLFPNINGPMHMKNVQDISFLFLKHGNIIDIQDGKSNSNQLHSNNDAEHVLEVPKGFVKRNKVQVGNPITLQYKSGGVLKFQNSGFFDTVGNFFKKAITLNGMDASRVAAQPSFGQAFAMAKQMGLRKFTYKDKDYTTDEKKSPVILKATKQSAPTTYQERGYLTDYLNHPASREKLKKRGYTTEEINKGLNNMATVETNISDPNTYSNLVNTSYGLKLQNNWLSEVDDEYMERYNNSPKTSLDKEKLKIDAFIGKSNLDAQAFYLTKKNKIYSTVKDKSTILHELGHSTKLDEKGIGEIGDVSYDKAEIFPRILELKYQLNFKPTDKLDLTDPKIQEKIIKSEWIKSEENQKIFKHKDFFHTFNEVVSNKKPIGNTFAKQGCLIKLQKGGVVPSTMNVIPRGVAHARKNSINPKLGLGPKGIPIINENGEKEAEVESNELTLSKNATDQLHKLYNQWKSNKSTNLEILAGVLISNQLKFNTADLTGKFLKEKDTKIYQSGGLLLLDNFGKPQAEIGDGVRIFSRISTKEIIRLFKSKDFKNLGKYVLRELFAQDKREPEFTNE